MTPVFNTLKPAYLIIAVGLCVYLLSVLQQCTVRRQLEPEDTLVLRLSHTRLEHGYTQALEAIIQDFKEYKARQGVKVDVQHNSISQSLYEPWLNTQLVGGTAPDIIEQPKNKYQHFEVYYATYFYNLDEMTNRQNPFNDFERIEALLGDLDLNRNAPAGMVAEYPELGEPYTVAQAIADIHPTTRELLRKQTHRSTFRDGMLGGYNFNAGHYYRFIISNSQPRLVYNKELIRAATGQDDPPQTLQAFFEMCAKLAELKTEAGRPLIPVTGTRETPAGIFQDKYLQAFTLEDSFNMSREGVYGLVMPHYMEYLKGTWTMYSPSLKAYYEFAREFASYLTPGFQALTNDSATFDFIHRRAAIRITEAEEAPSIFNQADFPVGVMVFPYPAPGERWYDFAMYPLREIPYASGQFSICRQSNHPELALEFMQFWTSRIWNERFNRFADLVPVIKSAEPSERLKPFLPVLNGVTGMPGFIQFPGPVNYSENVRLGQESRYLSGEIDYATFAASVDAAYQNPRFGINRNLGIRWENEKRYAKQVDRNISFFAGRELLLPSSGERDQRLLHYIIFRSGIYNNGLNTPWDYDRAFWDSDPLPPLPRP